MIFSLRTRQMLGAGEPRGVSCFPASLNISRTARNGGTLTVAAHRKGVRTGGTLTIAGRRTAIYALKTAHRSSAGNYRGRLAGSHPTIRCDAPQHAITHQHPQPSTLQQSAPGAAAAPASPRTDPGPRVQLPADRAPPAPAPAAASTPALAAAPRQPPPPAKPPAPLPQPPSAAAADGSGGGGPASPSVTDAVVQQPASALQPAAAATAVNAAPGSRSGERVPSASEPSGHSQVRIPRLVWHNTAHLPCVSHTGKT